MDATTLSTPAFPSKPLAATLDELLTELRQSEHNDHAAHVARVIALQNYLLALRLSVVSGDRNAMFDRLSAGIAACRAITNPIAGR